MPDNKPGRSRAEHWEAVRLSWKSHHVPVGTLFLMLIVLAGVLSAILMVLTESPSNPIP
jgi:hypothetical protein